MFHILVVEDDRELRNLFCTVLEKKGYTCIPAQNGKEALDLLDSEYIDLIITEIMMPVIDGYDFIKSLRDASYNQPVLIITAKDSFDDMEKGFRAGTDDYMVKPINVNEMALRVKALLKRAKINNERKLTVGNTVFEYDSLTVFTNKGEETLPQKEFLLLFKLISYPNHIFTRHQLMDEIWGMNSESDMRTVDVHIGRLRERFKDNKDFEIVTVRGLGYKAVKKREKNT